MLNVASRVDVMSCRALDQGDAEIRGKAGEEWDYQ